MKTVSEISRIAGVSVRTLHYYDSIGLLRPAKITEAGYRLYGDSEQKKLHTILMFRELGFSLTEIRNILCSPGFDLNEALSDHLIMLKMQKERIDRLINETEKMIKGGKTDFSVFEKSEMDKYAKEVKDKWGKTSAYSEYELKMKEKNEDEKNNMIKGLEMQFSNIGMLKDMSPSSEEAQNAVKELQNYITSNFYNCTKEILAGLGEMYALDERFRENIDSCGGTGTADFTRDAIRIFCKK